MPGQRYAPVFAIGALLLLLAGTSWSVHRGAFFELDRSTIVHVRELLDLAGQGWMAETARNVTSLGSVVVVLLIAGAFIGYLLIKSDRFSAAAVAVAVAGGQVSNDLLKMVFDRPRPDLALRSVQVYTSSFPSGHAALSAAAYLTMAALIARHLPLCLTKLYVMSAAIFLVFLIGLSRIYLGVHYPTDVLAGWCLGGVWALMCGEAGSRMQRYHAPNRRGNP